MLKLGSVRFRGKCSRHPGYDPREDGRGAIRGGCEKCEQLAEINDLHVRMLALMRAFTPPPPPRKRPAPASKQVSLFDEEF